MPKRLSLDEFSRRKGKGNLATIVTDLDKSSLLEVIDSHKSDDIIIALKQQPQGMREQVEEVSVDMWGGFPKVIKSVFPNAKVVIYRFHVQKLVSKALNKFRLKLELKGLKNRCLLMSNYWDLNFEEKQELAELLHVSPSLAIAHAIKEELISIYESDITPLGGIRKIKKWLISAKVLLGSAAESVEVHLTEIANYFHQKTTSGVTEGINTRIKLILRQSYGFKSFDAMKEKLLACLFK